MSQSEDRVAFGRTVLGPIFAEFALRLWGLLSNIECPENAVVLFCARGGFRLKMIYERFLAASGLQSPVAIRNLMVSRVVAVRTALAAGCPSAYPQIEYELGSGSLRDVARAIGGSDPVDGADDSHVWGQSYSSASLSKILASEEGRGLRSSIQRQADFFLEHLETCLAGCKHAILCDTGLSGSTMQLLEDGIPQVNWGCALFARSNYKNLSTGHFQHTVGLCVEADRYSLFDTRSAILRYWHLIESTLEPALPSVAMFDRVDGTLRTNLEIDGWQDRIDPNPGEIFSGILDYIDSLPRGRAAIQTIADVDHAYSKLRRAVTWPTPADVDTLNIGTRSLDFGRDIMSGLACEPGIRKALRGSLWREGAITLAAPSSRWLMFAAIEAAYIARSVLRSIKT